MRSSGLMLSCFLCLALDTQRARADEPLRVVLRIASDADMALVPRLRGQLSDVAAQLVVTETAPLEAALSEQLDSARTLAKLQRADAVVWCSSDPGMHRTLYIELAASDRILARALLGAPAGALSSSDLETIAVVVRSTLVALAQHVEIGVSADTVAAQSGELAAISVDASRQDQAQLPEATSDQAQPAAGPQPSAADETAPAIEMPSTLATDVEPTDHAEIPRIENPTQTRATLRARFTLGAQLALDGRSSLGQRGLSARAGVGFGAWALDAYGVVSMASSIDDPYFALSIARHALGVALERRVRLTQGLALGVALHAGALLLRRTSRAQEAEQLRAVSMPPSLTAAFALGPELALSWLPRQFGLSLRFGLDILPGPPRFEIAGLGQQAAVSHSLWSVEPRLTLGWETALP